MSEGTVEIVSVDDNFWDDGAELVACLQQIPPRVPAYFGYDMVGSELFEAITELPNYYLTRVEYELLQRHSTEIAELIGCEWFVELGSGSAKKTKLLLSACLERRPTVFMPIDVSEEMLLASGRNFAVNLPELRVQGLWGRYEAGLAWLRDATREPLLLAFLGSNLGNLTPEERDALLSEIASTLLPGDRFLVTGDMQKPGDVFEACYNDPLDKSVFARFRLNHLTHLNRRFGADFVLDYFHARAHYDQDSATVQAHLYATEDQSVRLRELDFGIRLKRGESLVVGYSYKFHRPQLVGDIAERGFELEEQWIDAVWQYGVFLFVKST